MVQDFRPPRPTDGSTRWLVKSVNDIKPDQLGNVDVAVGDLTDVDGDNPDNGDTFVYNSTTNVFEVGPSHGWKIDQFAITGTGTSVFTLDFEPIPDSWNVSCSWPLDDTVDYTIVGQTLTILAPATTFVGASGTYPKTLQVQYDYVVGAPPPPTPTGVLGSPFVWWFDEGGSSGHRAVYFNIPSSTGTEVITVETADGASGPGSHDADVSSFAFPANDTAPGTYLDTLWEYVMTRPYYEVGEVTPTGVRIVMDGIQVYGFTDPINLSLTAPPTNYDGTNP